jgi:4,5-dihydroxyphthalate decarboxylase
VRVHLTLAVSDYDHVRDLTSGRVAVEGVDLTCLQLPVEEIFFRFTAFREWHVSELSLTKYVAMVGSGDTSVAAIPVFPSRVFRHSAIYVTSLSSVRDLAGARIGIPEWFQTAGVWARGILAHEYRLRLEDITWVQAGLNEPGRREQFSPPAGITLKVEPDRTLTDMLVAGDLDAVISAHPPDLSRGIVRLFPDWASVERSWHERTGIYPIMHTVVLRRDVVDEHPWVAMNLYDAFMSARDRSLARALDLNASRFPVPWLPHFAASFEGDPFPYGVPPNRPTLETFLRYAYEQGITPRQVDVDELFLPQVTQHFRI